jgi:hypothetical protein
LHPKEPGNFEPDTVRTIVQKFLSGVILCIAGPAVSASEEKVVVELPEGDAKSVLVTACVGCHDLETTLSARKTGAAWEATVYDMMARGAQVFPDEVDMLVQYLEKNLGEKRNADTRH